jgi:hypothetical protein
MLESSSKEEEEYVKRMTEETLASLGAKATEELERLRQIPIEMWKARERGELDMLTIFRLWGKNSLTEEERLRFLPDVDPNLPVDDWLREYHRKLSMQPDSSELLKAKEESNDSDREDTSEDGDEPFAFRIRDPAPVTFGDWMELRKKGELLPDEIVRIFGSNLLIEEEKVQFAPNIDPEQPMLEWMQEYWHTVGPSVKLPIKLSPAALKELDEQFRPMSPFGRTTRPPIDLESRVTKETRGALTSETIEEDDYVLLGQPVPFDESNQVHRDLKTAAELRIQPNGEDPLMKASSCLKMYDDLKPPPNRVEEATEMQNQIFDYFWSESQADLVWCHGQLFYLGAPVGRERRQPVGTPAEQYTRWMNTFEDIDEENGMRDLAKQYSEIDLNKQGRFILDHAEVIEEMNIELIPFVSLGDNIQSRYLLTEMKKRLQNLKKAFAENKTQTEEVIIHNEWVTFLAEVYLGRCYEDKREYFIDENTRFIIEEMHIELIDPNTTIRDHERNEDRNLRELLVFMKEKSIEIEAARPEVERRWHCRVMREPLARSYVQTDDDKKDQFILDNVKQIDELKPEEINPNERVMIPAYKTWMVRDVIIEMKTRLEELLHAEHLARDYLTADDKDAFITVQATRIEGVNEMLIDPKLTVVIPVYKNEENWRLRDVIIEMKTRLEELKKSNERKKQERRVLAATYVEWTVRMTEGHGDSSDEEFIRTHAEMIDHALYGSGIEVFENGYGEYDAVKITNDLKNELAELARRLNREGGAAP